jgi:polar amino acid transport system substrate-binding protein
MRFLLLILVILLGSTSSLAATTKTITLAYSDVESFPFQMGNGTSVAEPPGLSLDVIEQAASMLNLKINYVRLPGKRVLNQIRTNQVDGGFIFSYNQERAQYAKYPMKEQKADSALRIATLDYFFYKLKDQPLKWDGAKLESTEETLVGAHTGFSIIKKLKQNKINTLEKESTEKLFEMLSKRRLTAVAVQSNIANSYIDENNLDNIEKVTLPISTKDYYLIFSPKMAEDNPALVKEIWRVIGEIRDKVIANNMTKYLAEEK